MPVTFFIFKKCYLKSLENATQGNLSFGVPVCLPLPAGRLPLLTAVHTLTSVGAWLGDSRPPTSGLAGGRLHHSRVAAPEADPLSLPLLLLLRAGAEWSGP